MRLAHFYHCFSGQWADPLAEHLIALRESGFDGEFHVGLVGPREYRDADRRALRSRPPARIVEAERGYEQHTLDLLHAYAQHNDGAVLYAHTKGASYGMVEGPWAEHRRRMTDLVVRRWRENLALLERFDAVGADWMPPPAEHPGSPVGLFSGNFWMATTRFIRSLPRCPRDEPQGRAWAELWLGLGNPRIFDVRR